MSVLESSHICLDHPYATRSFPFSQSLPHDIEQPLHNTICGQHIGSEVELTTVDWNGEKPFATMSCKEQLATAPALNSEDETPETSSCEEDQFLTTTAPVLNSETTKDTSEASSCNEKPTILPGIKFEIQTTKVISETASHNEETVSPVLNTDRRSRTFNITFKEPPAPNSKIKTKKKTLKTTSEGRPTTTCTPWPNSEIPTPEASLRKGLPAVVPRLNSEEEIRFELELNRRLKKMEKSWNSTEYEEQFSIAPEMLEVVLTTGSSIESPVDNETKPVIEYSLQNILRGEQLSRESRLMKPEDKLFESEICHKMPKTEVCLQFHERIHTEKTQFKRAQEHLYVNSQEKTFHCRICGLFFSNRKSLVEHEPTHLDEKPQRDRKQVMCILCNKGFDTVLLLNAHLKEVHPGETAYKCEICKKGYTTSENLSDHIRNVHSQKILHCKICGKGFRNRRSLVRHEPIHSEEKPHKCGFCGRGFVQKGYLKVHLRMHTGEKPYKCEQCDKTFSQPGSLQSHLSTHSDEKPHKCNICDKSFRILSTLREHLKIHSGEKAFKCQICEKSFRAGTDLKKHLVVHTQEKPFKCDTCSKCFATNSNLRNHMGVHSDEKPHTCEYCGQTFNRPATLTIHRRIHTGEEPYVCEFCQKGFKTKQQMDLHVRSHTNEKPYECDICRKKFRQSQFVKAHKKKVHANEKHLLSNVTTADIPLNFEFPKANAVLTLPVPQ